MVAPGVTPRFRRLFGEPAIWLAIAAFANTLSVAAEGWLALHTRLFGRRAWLAHTVVILPGWLCFLASLQSIRPGERRWPMGRLVEGIGAVMVGLGFLELGPAGAVNGDLFGLGSWRQQAGGIYQRLHNPIYSGYALLLLGRALRLGSVRLGLVAAESLLLLNVVEARVESHARARKSPTRR